MSIASSVKDSPGTPDRNLDAFTYPHQNCPYNQLVYKTLRQLGVGGFRMNDRVRIGAKAPDFALPSQSGETVKLKNFLGKPVVLLFYPKDNTLGCTKEVCAFRDDFQEFGILDAEVIGISSDSVEPHRAFVQKHDLPFALLSDGGGKVRKLYGVPNTLGLLPGRVTYVLDEAGVVGHIFSSQLGVERHVQEAINALRGHDRAPGRP
jgi:thioredoxin-dependent peroxiredoxin